MVRAFDEAIKNITDRELFLTIGYTGPEFRLKAKWDGQEIALRQLPDGLRAIVGWLASCMVKLDMLYPDADKPLEQPVILLLDEPDAHLHPAWQRKLIPAVQKMLPNAQIFIATHSPFVVSSVNHGWIHVFQADKKGIVTIQPAKACSPGDSYIDVVEDTLGVREMFDPETEEMLQTYRDTRDAFKKQPADKTKYSETIALAKQIGERSQTLSLMMGREIAQLQTNYGKVAG
ncbi:MAG: AAA family ATPase [Fimbriiglobus sp.]